MAWTLATKRTGAHFSLPQSVLLLAKLGWKIVNKILWTSFCDANQRGEDGKTHGDEETALQLCAWREVQ